MRAAFGIMVLTSAVASGVAAESESEIKASTWTGFYAGISAGAIFDKSHLDSSHIFFINPSYTEHPNKTEFLPGIQAGYNHQLASGLVLGGEAAFTYPDSTSTFTQQSPSGAQFDKFAIKNRLQGDIRARIGYALDNFLPYVTVGVSFADTRLRYGNEAGEVLAKNSVQAGWVMGGGLEYALYKNLSLRTEYLYSDYADPVSMEIRNVIGVTDPNGFAKADLVSHSIRAALNYRF